MLWRIGLGEDRNSMSAFLFTFPTGDTSKPAEKLVKVIPHLPVNVLTAFSEDVHHSNLLLMPLALHFFIKLGTQVPSKHCW